MTSSIVTDDDLFALAETVWSSVLGLELTRADDHDDKIGETAITSCVQIMGDWDGAVTVACSPAVATQLACAMFQLEPDDLSDDEVRDAMGEIANMTGGNVKGMAPGTNTLALPTVTEGEQGAFGIPGTSRLNRIVGSTDGSPVVVTVFGKDA
jgi:chemotaxis protein CheX